MHDAVGVFVAGDAPDELLDSFFEAEVEMERKICRDVVCTSRKDEEGKICVYRQFRNSEPRDLRPVHTGMNFARDIRRRLTPRD